MQIDPIHAGPNFRSKEPKRPNHPPQLASAREENLPPLYCLLNPVHGGQYTGFCRLDVQVNAGSSYAVYPLRL